MSDKYGVGIVGMGWVSGEHFKAYSNNEHAQVRGVCSLTVDESKAKLAELSATQCTEGVEVFATYEEMLACPEIQIVSVCSPPSLHPAQAIAAARAGKHVCIEKPLALNLANLRRIQQAVDEAGVKTIVSLECHYNPEVQVIKSLLDQGMIGEVFQCEADYYHGIGPWYAQWSWNITPQEGGSSYLSAGCHALDAVRYFAGSRVTEVSAFANSSRSNNLKYQYPPNTVCILKFENGVIGKCASSIEYIGPYYFPITINGDAGHIRNNQLWSNKIKGQQGMATIPTIMLDSGDVTHHPFQGEMDELLDCIVNDKESHLSVNNAAKTFEVVYAADQSAKEGRTIRIEEFLAK